MTVRRLDENHDWTFGQGKSNYIDGSAAVAQSVQCRLWSFENDWFLDQEHGLPWFQMIGRNVNLDRIEKEIRKTVLETEGVEKIDSYEAHLDRERRVFLATIFYTDIYKNKSSAIFERGQND